MNKPDQEGIRAISVASEYYEDHPEMKMVVSLIPGIGGAINEMLSAPANAARNKRMFHFMASVGQRLEQIEAHLDDAFASSPEFEGVVERILRSASQTSREEKLEILREAMVGTLQGDGHEPIVASLLVTVDALSPEHIRVMRFIGMTIREKRRADEPILRTKTRRDADLGRNLLVERQELEEAFAAWGEHQWESILGDLIAKGLVEPLAPAGTFRPNTAGRFRVTELGDELLSLLEKGRAKS